MTERADSPKDDESTESQARGAPATGLDWYLIGGLVVFAGLLCVASFGLGAAFEAGDRSNAGQYVLDFMKSSGFGAVAAVSAALVAVLGVQQQLKVAKSAKRSDEWWRMFEWAAGTKSDPRPANVTQATLSALVPLATGTAEELACQALQDHLLAEMKAAPAAGEGPSEISALRHYVEVARGTSAASKQAESYVLSEDFKDCIRDSSPLSSVVDAPPRDTADLELRAGGHRIGVVIALESSVTLRSHIQESVKRREGGYDGWIVVYRKASRNAVQVTESLDDNVVAVVLPDGVQGAEASSQVRQALERLSRTIGTKSDL